MARCSKRFYGWCCFLIVSYNIFLRRGDASANTRKVISGSTAPLISQQTMQIINENDSYTLPVVSCRYTKRWVVVVNYELCRRTWFVDSCGFIQSLILLICFSCSVVLSGTAFALFFLLQSFGCRHFPISACISLCFLVVGQSTNLAKPSCFDSSTCTSNCKQLKCENELQRVSDSIHLVDYIKSLALILLLLLMSGDVERNPGPLERMAGSNQALEEPEHEVSNPERQHTIIEETNSANVCDLRSCDANKTSASLNLVSLDQAVDRFDIAASNARELDFSSPQCKRFEMTQEELQPREYVVVSLDANYVKEATYSEGLQEVPDYFLVEHCHKSKGQYAEYVNKELESLHGLQESFAKEELDECTMVFFEHSNKLYRAGCHCNYCSICGKRKSSVVSDNTSGDRGSHIFPEGVLKVFRRIHCYNAKCSDSEQKHKHDDIPKEYTELIYDFVLDERLGTAAWNYHLLCSRCEMKCSAAEKKLRDVYVDMMSCDAVTFLNEKHWFNYILANIMFRGLLVGKELSFNDPLFKAGFTKLWNYCKSDLIPTIQDDMLRPDLKLFLFPNNEINKEMSLFLYSFEYSLRCPMFTRHVNSKEGGSFFYWKFDCFHVTLDLDDTSHKYFTQFLDILVDHGQGKLVLQWTKTCCTAVEDETSKMNEVPKRDERSAVRIKYKPGATPQIFPPALLEENIHLNNEFTTKIYHQACVTDHRFNLLSSSKIMTDRYEGLGHRFPILDCSISRKINEYPPSEFVTLEVDFSRDRNDNEHIEKAASLSPLRLPERIRKLEAQSQLHETVDDTVMSQFMDMKKRRDEAEQKLSTEKKRSKDKHRNAGRMNLELKKRVRSTNNARFLLSTEIRQMKRQLSCDEKCSQGQMHMAKTIMTICMDLLRQSGVNLPEPLETVCCEVFEYIGSHDTRAFHLEYLDLAFNSQRKAVCATTSIPVDRSLSC